MIKMQIQDIETGEVIAAGGCTGEITGTTIIPSDDTIPQNTEGTEVVRVSNNPSPVKIKALIVAKFKVAHASKCVITAALFRDSDPAALLMPSLLKYEGGTPILRLGHYVEIPAHEGHSFSVRIGADKAGTLIANPAPWRELGVDIVSP